jgi:precorrin-6Y C5,15-methyltransferase (decarboxylating)
LLERQIDYFSAYVCENLGSRDERVTHGALPEIIDQHFGPLNVMILVRMPGVPDRPAEMVGTRIFGNPDDLFQQSQPKRGLLTRMEIRVVALAELDLGPRSIVWDVGAGTGSVSIEAARLVPDGKVFAIEMDPNDQQLLMANSQTFRVRDNLIPILGKAPEAWEKLPDPDAIFVGGTGRAVARLVQEAWHRLRPHGRLVVHVNSLENLTAVRKTAVDRGCDVAVRMINIAHSIEQLDEIRFEAMNPTFLMTIVKAGS